MRQTHTHFDQTDPEGNVIPVGETIHPGRQPVPVGRPAVDDPDLQKLLKTYEEPHGSGIFCDNHARPTGKTPHFDITVPITAKSAKKSGRHLAHRLWRNVTRNEFRMVYTSFERANLTFLAPQSDDALLNPGPHPSVAADPWLWPQRIARGDLALLIGEPGVGSSFLIADLAARVSRGLPWPDERVSDPAARRSPGRVVIVSAQDDIDLTIKKRIADAGGDLSNVMVIHGAVKFDVTTKQAQERSPQFVQTISLDRDMPLLRAAVEEWGDVHLLVIDPLLLHLSAERESQLRPVFTELAAFARKTGLAVVLTMPPQRGPAKAGVRSVVRSESLATVARSVWRLSPHPNDGTRRELRAIKNVHAPESESGLAFQFQSGRLQWSELPAEPPAIPPPKPAAQREWLIAQGLTFLIGFLRQFRGRVSWKEAKSAALEAGIPATALQAAAFRLGMRCEYVTTETGSELFWVAPENWQSLAVQEVPPVRDRQSNDDVADTAPVGLDAPSAATGEAHDASPEQSDVGVQPPTPSLASQKAPPAPNSRSRNDTNGIAQHPTATPESPTPKRPSQAARPERHEAGGARRLLPVAALT